MDRRPAGTPGSFRLLDALYHDEPMRAIWSHDRTVAGWLRVESELAQAQADVGLITHAEADAISAACRLEAINLDELWKDARTVGYPILPLVRQIVRSLPPGPAGRVHHGATTQDIMDSGLAGQLVASCDRLVELAVRLGDGLATLAGEHAHTVMAARTHAQQAVPTTFGAKVAVFLGEVAREVAELREVREAVRVVSLHGAAGTNAAMGEAARQVRRILAQRLGLTDADLPWHVARDRVARFGQACGLIAATCVRFAREIIDLSRTEIAEVRERDGHHRGASSTMPQKANPISSESVVGYGVAAAAASTMLLRAMEAGHERSAGEWQIEWLAVPEVAEYTAAAVMLCADTAATLQVFPDVMRANLSRDGGLLMTEALMMRLAPVLGRQHAHDVVYAAAAEARVTGEDVVQVCARMLPGGESTDVDLLGTDPLDYLGEAPEVAAAARARWQAVRDPVAAGTADQGGEA